MKRKIALAMLLLGVMTSVGCSDAQSPPAGSALEVTESGMNKSIAEFQATSVDGEIVNEKIFQDYDVTMIYLWEAKNGESLEELEELQQLYTALPENVNLITVCKDAKTDLKLATDMLTSKGCEFDTFISDNEIEDQITSNLTVFPSTVFVNKQGRLLGVPEEGTPRDGVVQGNLDKIAEYMKVLEEK